MMTPDEQFKKLLLTPDGPEDLMWQTTVRAIKQGDTNKKNVWTTGFREYSLADIWEALKDTEHGPALAALLMDLDQV